MGPETTCFGPILDTWIVWISWLKISRCKLLYNLLLITTRKFIKSKLFSRQIFPFSLWKLQSLFICLHYLHFSICTFPWFVYIYFDYDNIFLLNKFKFLDIASEESVACHRVLSRYILYWSINGTIIILGEINKHHLIIEEIYFRSNVSTMH